MSRSGFHRILFPPGIRNSVSIVIHISLRSISHIILLDSNLTLPKITIQRQIRFSIGHSRCNCICVFFCHRHPGVSYLSKTTSTKKIYRKKGNGTFMFGIKPVKYASPLGPNPPAKLSTESHLCPWPSKGMGQRNACCGMPMDDH